MRTRRALLGFHDHGIRELVGRIATKHGYDVVLAEDLGEMRRYAESDPFEAYIMDVNLNDNSLDVATRGKSEDVPMREIYDLPHVGTRVAAGQAKFIAMSGSSIVLGELSNPPAGVALALKMDFGLTPERYL